MVAVAPTQHALFVWRSRTSDLLLLLLSFFSSTVKMRLNFSPSCRFKRPQQQQQQVGLDSAGPVGTNRPGPSSSPPLEEEEEGGH